MALAASGGLVSRVDTDMTGDAASREGRHRTSYSRADPRGPDNVAKQELSGEKEKAALLTFLPAQHGALVRTNYHHRAPVPQRSHPKTLTDFFAVQKCVPHSLGMPSYSG